jgi:hypothetical protein
MDQPVVLAVGASVGLGGPLEREGVGGQGGQRQLPAEPPGQLGPAAAVPPGREDGREGGDLGAAQGQPAAVEGGPQRQGDRLGAVPEQTSAVPSWASSERAAASAWGLPLASTTRSAPRPPVSAATTSGAASGSTAPDAEGRGRGPPRRLRLRSQHHRPGPGQQRHHQDADRAQANDQTVSPSRGAASRATWRAVSTIGYRVAARGSRPSTGTASPASVTNRSWWGGRRTPAGPPARARPGGGRGRPRCSRSGTGR